MFFVGSRPMYRDVFMKLIPAIFVLLCAAGLALAGEDAPRGDSVDRAMAAATAGRQASIGAWLLNGGAHWTLSPAPPRR